MMVKTRIYFEDLIPGIVVDIKARRGKSYLGVKFHRYVLSNEPLSDAEVDKYYGTLQANYLAMLKKKNSQGFKKLTDKTKASLRLAEEVKHLQRKCLTVARAIFSSGDIGNTSYVIIPIVLTISDNYTIELHDIHGKPRIIKEK